MLALFIATAVLLIAVIGAALFDSAARERTADGRHRAVVLLTVPSVSRNAGFLRLSSLASGHTLRKSQRSPRSSATTHATA